MVAAAFQSIVPSVDDRIPVSSTFVITYGEDLDPTTVIIANIIFVDANNTPVPFSVSNVPASQITINPTSNLTVDTLYSITLTSNIYDVKTIPEPIDQKNIKFIAEVLSDIPSIDLLIDGNPNDIFYKSNLISKLLDPLEIIDEGTKYNFSYVPSFKDDLTGKYSHQSVEKLTFDNQSLFQDLLRREILSTFDDYFETIESFNVLTDNDIQVLKKLLLRKSYDINTSAGLKNLIQFLVEIMANTSGKYFVDVEPDDILPLVYHVSTDMDKEHWTKVLKRIVHPVSWNDIYVQVVHDFFDYYQTEQYHWEQLFLIDSFRVFFGLRGVDIFRQIGKTIDGTLLTTGIDRALTIPELRSNHLKGTDVGRSFISEPETYQSFASIANHVPETERSQLLAVLNNLRPKNKFAFSYLEANRLGSNFNVSRLTQDSSGDLQLIVVPGQTLPFNIVEIASDVTFFYDSDTAPILWVSSIEFNDQQYEFGNVIMEAGTGAPTPDPVPEDAAISGTTYEIASINNPVNNIQTIIFTDNITGIVLDGDTIVVTGFTIDTDNNGTFDVLTTNTITNSLTISNSAGSAETGGVTVLGEHQRAKHHYPPIFIIPGTFSDDFQLWNGYKVFFDMGRIDPGDDDSKCEFNFQYAEYDAPIVYPTIGTGDTAYDALVVDINLAKHQSESTSFGEYIKYTLTSSNVTWAHGNKVYEYDGDGKTTGWIVGTNAILTTNSERLVLESDIDEDSTTYQDVTTIVGNVYSFTASMVSAVGNVGAVRGEIEAQDTSGNKLARATSAATTLETLNITFTAIETTTRIILRTKTVDQLRNMSSTATVVSSSSTIMNLNKLAFGGTSSSNVGSLAHMTRTLNAFGGNIYRSFYIEAPAISGNNTNLSFNPLGFESSSHAAVSGSTAGMTINGDIRTQWDDAAVRDYVLGEEYDPNLLTNGDFQRNRHGLDIGRIEKVNGNDIITRFLKDIIPNAVLAEESGPTYIDYTTEAGESTTNDVPLMPVSPVDSNGTIIGGDEIFSNMYFNIGTAGVGTWTITWQYWNGSNWDSLLSVTDNTTDFKTAGRNEVVFTTPTDWKTTIIDGKGPYYYLKASVTGFVTGGYTRPLGDLIEINNHFNTDKYYTNIPYEAGVVGTSFDTTTEFGSLVAEYDRKATLGFNIPDLSSYTWNITAGTGSETVQFNNEFMLMGLSTQSYNVSLDVTIDETEITKIVCVADISDSLDGTYFLIKSASDATSYYVWYSTPAAAADPAPGGTGINVVISTGESADDVAIKTAFELDAIGSGNDFITTVTTDTITVTNQAQGATTDAVDFDTGFTITVTQQGRTNSETGIQTFTGL